MDYADGLREWGTWEGIHQWQAGRPLSTNHLLANLKLYGRLVEIPGERLTLTALRNTAIRLRLEGGSNPDDPHELNRHDLKELQAFLDCQEELKFTKSRLIRMPELPKEEGDCSAMVCLPDRRAKPFLPGEGMTHGFYARSQPPEAVAAVLAEDIQGIEEEIVGLRILGRILLERQVQAKTKQEATQLVEAYTLTVYRLAETIKAEKELEKGKESEWANEVLDMLDKFAIEQLGKPVSEEARADALGGKPELGTSSRRLVEEIAAMRHVLRNVFQLAVEAVETRDFIRLAEIYSCGCLRLVKLLKIEGSDAGKLETYLSEAIDHAIAKVALEQTGKPPRNSPKVSCMT